MQQPFVLTIFGASGDLTRRKLVPALFDLFCADLLPKQFIVLGYARRDWDRAEFIKNISSHLEESASDNVRTVEFFEHFEYQRGDFGEAGDYRKLAKRLDSLNDQLGQCGQRLFYLATSAESYHQILEGIADAKLQVPCDEAGWTRLVIEKPFGHNLASAQRLDKQLMGIFAEEQIYRIDHYLAKETVQNILAFRFANTIFEALWNAEHIERIEVVVAETEGVGTRGRFYDATGAIRDVLQNHILQLLALIAMEQPANDSPAAFRQARANTIGSLKMINSQELNTKIVLGQYEGYQKVENVDPASHTETFVLLEVELATPRWQGMPIYLATGKALHEHFATISVYFKEAQTPLFDRDKRGSSYNSIVFHLQPRSAITVQILAKEPGYKHRLEPVEMHFNYHESFSEQGVDAYSRLLLDAMEGDQRLFTRSDEVEAEWGFIDPIIEGLHAKHLKPQSYKPGSRGPRAAQGRLRSL